MALSAKEMEEAIIRNLPQKTGKTLADWIRLVREQGPTEEKRRLEWLKQSHGLGHFQATTILKRMEGDRSEYEDGNVLVDDIFKIGNDEIRAIYKSIEEQVQSLGNDVKIKPTKTYVPFYRNRQFMVIKPTKELLLIGLSLPSNVTSKRLQKAKGLGASDRINVMMAVSNMRDVDKELLELIRQSYSAN